MSSDDLAPVRLPARDIPPPATISDKARAALSEGALGPDPGWPPAHDLDAWRAAVAGSAAMWEEAAAPVLAASPSKVQTRTIGGVTCHVATPPRASGEPVYMFIHGGAFVFGAGAYAKAQGAIQADHLGFVTVSVDYRTPPDHPFPAAAEDCFAVYKALIETHDPSRIVIGGSSAGGNLAAAAMLMIGDRGLKAPAGLVLLTPEVDLTEAGDSFRTNVLLDTSLKGPLPDPNAVYAAGHDLTDPYLSPLYGELSGFPPTLVQTGTRDILLSNSVLMHRKLRKAGVEAELHVWEAMPHGGFGPFGAGDAPENAEIDDEVRRFIGRHT
ncbi:MAG: alpha/beta hydrolase [Caulobacteraceae bacterium]